MKRMMMILLVMVLVCGGIANATQATLAEANAQLQEAIAGEIQNIPRRADVLMDVPTADVDWFVTSATFEDGTLSLAHAYNVYPRNVTVTITDPNDTVDAFTVIVTGVTQKGLTIAETFVYDDWTSGVAMVGNAAYLYLTSVVVSDCNNLDADETITVGFGTKMGLVCPLQYTSDVLNVSVIDGPTAHITATANVVYDTVDLSNTAPNGSHDYLVFYMSRED